MKILYVEDNPDAVSSIRRITSHFNYDLLVADTVEKGLTLLSERPNLVLADMLLPDGDAIKFVSQARPQWATLPIIIVTGYAPDGEREACFAAGCTDYFIKPVDVTVLIALFKRYSSEIVE